MTITEYVELNRSTGGFVCVSAAAGLAGVSRSRMWRLVNGGRLATVVFQGQRMVKLPDLQVWARGPRKPGRPRAASAVGARVQKQTSAGRASSLRRAVKAARGHGGGPVIKASGVSSLFDRLKNLRRIARGGKNYE